MAKQREKDSRENGANGEHDLIAMARGHAEIATIQGLSELIVDTKEVTLTIRRGVHGGAMAQVAMPAPMPIAMHAPAPAAIAHAPAPAPVVVVDDKSHVVTSPFVGTFYRKPNPD